MSSNERPRNGFTSHDEPIVVDNRPVRVDLSRKKRPTSIGREWTRQFTHFHQLVAMVVENDEAVPLAEVYKLHNEAPLVLHLDDGTNTDTLTFVPKGREELGMSTKVFEFEEGSGADKRLTIKNGKKPRVVRITGRTIDNDPIDIPLDGDRKPKHILVVVTSAPEEQQAPRK
jgi:hypothetical protein